MPYCSECLRSVLAQSFSDIEILVVDAGSTDGTLEVLEGIIKKDARIQLIHSEIKSYGHQVNIGIEKATGDYIGIVEPDDIIKPDMYEILYEKAVSNQVDFAKADYEYLIEINEDTRWTRRQYTLDKGSQRYGIVLDPKENIDLIERDIYLWRGLYKRSFLLLNHIRLSETKGAAYQDSGFLFQTISKASRVVYIDKSFYQYRRSNENASVFNIKGLTFVREEYEHIYNYLMSDNKIKSLYEQSYYKRLYDMVLARFDYFAQKNLNIADNEELKKEITCLYGILKKANEEGLLERRMDTLSSLLDTYRFLEDPYNQYQNMVFRYKVYQTILNKFTGALKPAAQIVLFGAGEAGDYVFCLLEKNKINKVVAFCDNMELTEKKYKKGLQVLNPREAVLQYGDACYVIAAMSNDNRKAMGNQLIKLGISPQCIVEYRLWMNYSFLL